ncbi:hypothetical protein BKA66DRAFT_569905 [Pyrenochaeta sp. MPI-SDFR-AT-0127]|nr:hypothetical protein BKA66DRAFT_569905 [Pyrenochaeta sp. MPI-SDFR-AT-0127]
MSTRSPSDASARSTNSASSASSNDTAQPNFAKFERYLLELIDLARRILQPAKVPKRRNSIILAADKVLNVQDRLSKYFEKYPDYDFTNDGVYRYIIEMQTLMRMIEVTLALSHGKVNWPDAGMGDQEREELQRSVYVEVEEIVFGERRARREEMPWNIDTRGETKICDGVGG